MLTQTQNQAQAMPPQAMWVRTNIDPVYAVCSSGMGLYRLYPTLAEAEANIGGAWSQGCWIGDRVKIFHPGELQLDQDFVVWESGKYRHGPCGKEELFPNHTGIFWSERMFL